jgi:hypothetical protein
MKYLLTSILGFLCGARLLAAEPLVPETFLAHCGVYRGTDSDVVRELTIQTNKLWLDASGDQHNSSAGSFNWIAAPHWFVYVAKDMRVWAYNGERFFILLEADLSGSRTVPLADLHEAPPPAVLKRLPRTMRKLLPRPNQSGAANPSQPVRPETHHTSPAAGPGR